MQPQPRLQLPPALEQALRWQADIALERWADRALAELIPTLGALDGVLYMMEVPTSLESNTTESLRWVAGYGRAEGYLRRIGLGEGLTGQVAKTQTPVYLPELSVRQVKPHSGLSAVSPRALLVMPLAYAGTIQGVLEVTSAKLLSDTARTWAQQAAQTIGAQLANIRNQLRVQQLYTEAREKARQLALREEELRRNVLTLEQTQEDLKLAQREAERRAIQLAESQITARVGSWEVNLENTHVTWSDNTYRLFSVDAGLPVSEGFMLSLIHPQDVPLTRIAYEALVKNGQDMDIEVRAFSNRELRFYNLRARRLITEDGRTYRVLGTVQDVTRRKTQENIIHQQNEELRAREEEMRQNYEELQTIQETLKQKAYEIEKLRLEADKRADEQKESLKRIMEKLVEKSRSKEETFTQVLAKKDEELKALQAQLTAVTTKPRKSKAIKKKKD